MSRVGKATTAIAVGKLDDIYNLICELSPRQSPITLVISHVPEEELSMRSFNNLVEISSLFKEQGSMDTKGEGRSCGVEAVFNCGFVNVSAESFDMAGGAGVNVDDFMGEANKTHDAMDEFLFNSGGGNNIPPYQMWTTLQNISGFTMEHSLHDGIPIVHTPKYWKGRKFAVLRIPACKGHWISVEKIVYCGQEVFCLREGRGNMVYDFVNFPENGNPLLKYEMERLENIRRNQARLQELGLVDCKLNNSTSNAKPRSKKNRLPQIKTKRELRSSYENSKVVNYDETRLSSDDDETSDEESAEESEYIVSEDELGYEQDTSGPMVVAPTAAALPYRRFATGQDALDSLFDEDGGSMQDVKSEKTITGQKHRSCYKPRSTYMCRVCSVPLRGHKCPRKGEKLTYQEPKGITAAKIQKQSKIYEEDTTVTDLLQQHPNIADIDVVDPTVIKAHVIVLLVKTGKTYERSRKAALLVQRMVTSNSPTFKTKMGFDELFRKSAELVISRLVEEDKKDGNNPKTDASKLLCNYKGMFNMYCEALEAERKGLISCTSQ